MSPMPKIADTRHLREQDPGLWAQMSGAERAAYDRGRLDGRRAAGAAQRTPDPEGVPTPDSQSCPKCGAATYEEQTEPVSIDYTVHDPATYRICPDCGHESEPVAVPVGETREEER